jgi:hypothetical protein
LQLLIQKIRKSQYTNLADRVINNGKELETIGGADVILVTGTS